MARAGERLYDPVIGDSIEFRGTAVGAPPMHVHPFQEEHFEVLSGTVGIQIEDEQRSLGEGEQATVPPGTPHTWYSEDDQEEKARFEHRDPLGDSLWACHRWQHRQERPTQTIAVGGHTQRLE